MNRGDTQCVKLNYTVNGSPMVEGAYQEIEIQFNMQRTSDSVKKLLSTGDIVWGTVTYLDEEEVEQTFTGYYTNLSQEETFKLSEGNVEVQLRVMLNGEVGSSRIEDFSIGRVLSTKVLSQS